MAFQLFAFVFHSETASGVSVFLSRFEAVFSSKIYGIKSLENKCTKLVCYSFLEQTWT